MKGSGDFSIGSKVWPGTSKLIEEIGELQQVLGKLIQCPDMNHWDGDLRTKLIEEIGDAAAAIRFFMEKNMSNEMRLIQDRGESKLELFRKWHQEQSA